MSNYYDGTKLLSLKDINGKEPEIYIVTSNRTAGKTTFFGRLMVRRFLSKGDKFCLMYRYNYELEDCAEMFFKDIGGLFFPGYEMVNKRRAKGAFHELYLNDKHCGYAVSINNADTLKRYSHLLSDVSSILFDEFQSESGNYCPNEIQKFISIHTSIARGQGSMYRMVQVYMLSNMVTLINPYYVELGISSKLNDKTKFLRGNGFVLEQACVEEASIAQRDGAFNKAFSSNKYVNYSSQSIYLNDNAAFIEKPKGVSKYICTIKYLGKHYGVRQFSDLGIVYVDDKSDRTFCRKITVTTEDHEVNYVMLRMNDSFIQVLRYYFEKGCLRFKNLLCKEALLNCIKY